MTQNFLHSHGKRYASYSQRYRSYANYYYTLANRYDYYGSYFGRVEGYYLKRSKQLYAEANALQVKAKEFKRLSKQTSQQNENQVTQAYKEILADANYVYHYKVLAQNSLGKVTKYLSAKRRSTPCQENPE